MWTWLLNSPSVQARSYSVRLLLRRSDTYFVTCPSFHSIGQTDYELVRVNLRLVSRPSLAGN